MLNNFRKNTKVIVWSVVTAFLLWGAFSVGTQFKKEGRYAGNVFGKNVTFQEYDRFYKAGQIFSFSGKDVKDPNLLRQATWQGIIFSREAQRQKINVSDNEVREQILKLLESQKINPDNYEAWLERGLRETPKQFEDQVREMLRIQKLFSVISPSENSIKVSVEDAKKAFLQENDQVSAEVIHFPDKSKAASFRAQLKTPKNWEKEKIKSPKAFQLTGLMPTEALSTILQISPADSLKLQALEKNGFSEVISTGKEFAVFFIVERKKGSEKDFEAAKDQYLTALKDRKKQNALLEKTHEILGRAQLKDYLSPSAAASDS